MALARHPRVRRVHFRRGDYEYRGFQWRTHADLVQERRSRRSRSSSVVSAGMDVDAGAGDGDDANAGDEWSHWDADVLVDEREAARAEAAAGCTPTTHINAADDDQDDEDDDDDPNEFVTEHEDNDARIDRGAITTQPHMFAEFDSAANVYRILHAQGSIGMHSRCSFFPICALSFASEH